VLVSASCTIAWVDLNRGALWLVTDGGQDLVEEWIAARG
jgi:hypothetical protein